VNNKNVLVKTEKELDLMRESGRMTALALQKVIRQVKPGVTLAALDVIAREEIERLGGGSSFKSVPGYFWTTCLTVNDEVVHGIPRQIVLKEGDTIGIDLGAVYLAINGWHTDAAWSLIVPGGGIKEDLVKKRRFLKVGEDTLWLAVSQAVAGKRIGDISSTIQRGVEKAGYSVVKSLAGHGVGRSGHEEPEIPTFGREGTGMVLEEGMTLAIEVIYTAGNGTVFEKEDGWTIATVDKEIGGLFEMSVIVGKNKPEIITDWRKV